MNERFFSIDPNNIVKNNFKLSSSESNHFLKSLRGNIGDEIWLLDGIGTAYKSKVSQIVKSLIFGKIIKKFIGYGELKYNIHLGIGIIKGSRMNILLEKATELGVKTIQPLVLDRCIKSSLNSARSIRIIQSAAKQSGRSFYPKIFEPINLNEWLGSRFNGKKILFHISANIFLPQILNDPIEDLKILIGPEGDFSENELAMLLQSKVQFASLGSIRLRSETAALSALANINQIYQSKL